MYQISWAKKCTKKDLFIFGFKSRPLSKQLSWNTTLILYQKWDSNPGFLCEQPKHKHCVITPLCHGFMSTHNMQSAQNNHQCKIWFQQKQLKWSQRDQRDREESVLSDDFEILAPILFRPNRLLIDCFEIGKNWSLARAWFRRTEFYCLRADGRWFVFDGSGSSGSNWVCVCVSVCSGRYWVWVCACLWVRDR